MIRSHPIMHGIDCDERKHRHSAHTDAHVLLILLSFLMSSSTKALHLRPPIRNSRSHFCSCQWSVVAITDMNWKIRGVLTVTYLTPLVQKTPIWLLSCRTTGMEKYHIYEEIGKGKFSQVTENFFAGIMSYVMLFHCAVLLYYHRYSRDERRRT